MIKMYISRHVEYRLLSGFKKNGFLLKVFEKYCNMKFHENPSSGSRVVSCVQTGGRRDRHDEANSRFFAILRTLLKRNMKADPSNIMALKGGTKPGIEC
jgi:hypothetical protein